MAPITYACGSATDAQAAYCFMDHEDVQFETILPPHYAATLARISEQGEGAVVLVAQDTSSLNYSRLKIDGIGTIGSKVDGAQGLHLHSSLSFTTKGVPLGFLDAQCWVRDPEEFGQAAERRAWPIEDKESYRWIKGYQEVAAVQRRNPHIQRVSVGDREADFYELMAISSATVTLCPPKDKAQLPALQVQVVLAQEEKPPRGAEPIDWRLLSTVAVDGFERACELAAWYTKRWGIEGFHRILKSGCKVEERQLRRASEDLPGHRNGGGLALPLHDPAWVRGA